MGSNSRSPSRPQILDSDASKLVERGHITTSSEFVSYVHQRKTEAERRKADYQTEIDRLEAEIQSRLMLIADEDAVIRRADAALTLDIAPNVTAEVQRPAPTLEPAVRVEVLGASASQEGTDQ